MKNVFITGGNGDIGLSIKKKFIAEGYNVIAPTSKELDLSNLVSVDNFSFELIESISIFIYCAGINEPKPYFEISNNDMQRTMDVNTFSFLRLVKKISSFMITQKEGYILGISSIYSFLGRNGRVPYVMSKHAMNGLVKTLAIELGCHNILVNNLSPGFVDTKLTRKNNTDEQIKSFEKMIPLLKLAAPDDIANIAYFLCSSQNKYITGQNIVVDGGLSVGGFQN